MFEIIGLLIGTTVLFIVSTFAGLVLWTIAYTLVPKGRAKRRRALTASFVLPILTMAYLWVCTALLPQRSLFGDIDQTLPNGYHLTGLAKMPEYSTIGGGEPVIEALDVNGPLLAAQVCQTCDAAFVQGAVEPYFLVDTTTKNTTWFATTGELAKAFRKPVHLTKTEEFESLEPAAVRTRLTNRLIMFVPPSVLLLLLFLQLVRLRYESS